MGPGPPLGLPGPRAPGGSYTWTGVAVATVTRVIAPEASLVGTKSPVPPTCPPENNEAFEERFWTSAPITACHTGRHVLSLGPAVCRQEALLGRQTDGPRAHLVPVCRLHLDGDETQDVAWSCRPGVGGWGVGHSRGSVWRSLCFWWERGHLSGALGEGSGPGPCDPRCSGLAPRSSVLPAPLPCQDWGYFRSLQLLSRQEALGQEGEFGETHAGPTQGLESGLCGWGRVASDGERPQEAWESSLRVARLPLRAPLSQAPRGLGLGSAWGAPRDTPGQLLGRLAGRCVLGEIPPTRLSTLGLAPPRGVLLTQGSPCPVVIVSPAGLLPWLAAP